MSITKTNTREGARYQVRYRDPDGRQVAQRFDTKREALAFQTAELSRIARGDWLDPRLTQVKFGDWADQWLQSNPGKRDTSYVRDEIIVRLHLKPMFAARLLNQISPMDVQGAVNVWSAKYAPHTAQRHYRTLAAIFRAAVNCDMVIKSPCRAIKLPRVPLRKAHIISSSELAALAYELGDHGVMALLGATLGLRWGEAAGLRVIDLDLLQGRLHVRQQISRDRSGRPVISVPKTQAAIRTMTIPPSVVSALAHHMASNGLSMANSEAFIFPDASGGPLSYSNWRRRHWVPACKQAGLPGLGFHDLRRANATAMVATGVDIKTAQSRLGHADPRMTLSIYAQSTSSGDAEAASRLEQQFMAQ